MAPRLFLVPFKAIDDRTKSKFNSVVLLKSFSLYKQHTNSVKYSMVRHLQSFAQLVEILCQLWL